MQLVCGTHQPNLLEANTQPWLLHTPWRLVVLVLLAIRCCINKHSLASWGRLRHVLFAALQSLLKRCPGEWVHLLTSPVAWGNKHQVPTAERCLHRTSWAGCGAQPRQAPSCGHLWLLQAVLGSRADPFQPPTKGYYSICTKATFWILHTIYMSSAADMHCQFLIFSCHLTICLTCAAIN